MPEERGIDIIHTAIGNWFVLFPTGGAFAANEYHARGLVKAYNDHQQAVGCIAYPVRVIEESPRICDTCSKTIQYDPHRATCFVVLVDKKIRYRCDRCFDQAG